MCWGCRRAVGALSVPRCSIVLIVWDAGAARNCGSTLCPLPYMTEQRRNVLHACRPPPTAVDIAKIKKRRLGVRLEQILAMVKLKEAPTETDLNLLQDALTIPGFRSSVKCTVEEVLGAVSVPWVVGRLRLHQ